MTKNIAVIDEQGIKYEATYLKRAKGLVKSGRARFVDEKTICLARPPDKSEDKTMSENMGSKNFGSENLNAKNLNAEKTNSESLSAEGLSTKNPDSQGLDPKDLSSVEELKKRAAAYVDAAKSSTEDLKKSVMAHLAAVQPKPGEVQGKTGEEQEKQSQEKALSREIVERVLDQLDHFAPDDSYLTTLAMEHSVEGNDMVEVVSLRESTRQKQLEVYKTVLEKAIENEAPAHVNFVDAMADLERITDWMAALDRDDFDPETWEMIRTKAFELLERVTASA